jgi:TonB-dependent receptor
VLRITGIKACWLGVALSFIAPAAGAFAFSDVAELDADTRQTYAIETRTLEEALIAYSLTSGVDVIYADAVLQAQPHETGIRLYGVFDAREALSRILSGRGLEPVWRSASLAVIRRTPVQSPAASAPVQTGAIEAAPPEVEVITVHGLAGAARQSIARKRFNAVISETLSSNDMGDFPNANLTEALARLPGLNAVRNQATGEGDRITIRGLSSEYNAYSMNGVRLGGTGSPDDYFYRGVRLSFLSPEGVERITVRKTATPDADGDVIGGAIDIETPLAFDFEEDFTSLSFEARGQDRFDRGVSPAFSGALARQFGGHWGVFAAGFFDRQRYGYDQIGDNGDHLPSRWYADAQDPDAVWDYASFQQRGWELSRGLADVERYGLNGAVSWRNDDHALHLRGQTNRYEESGERHQLKIRNRAGDRSLRFIQTDASQATLADPSSWRVVGQDEALGAIYGYAGDGGWVGDVSPDQIRDVDNDGRITDADARCRSYYSLCGASGVYDPQDFSIVRELGASRLIGQASSVDLAGESRFGPAFELQYALAYARSREEVDYDYGLEFTAETGEDAPDAPLFNQPFIGFEVSNPRFPALALGEDDLQALQTLSHYGFDELEIERSGVKETLLQGAVDLVWRPDRRALQRVQAGIKVTRSERERHAGAPRYDPDRFEGLTLADLDALSGEPVTSLFGGRYRGLTALGPTLDAARVMEAIGADFEAPVEDRVEGFSYDELSRAAYVMGEWRTDPWTVLAGVRAAHIEYEVGGHYATLQADPDAEPLPATPYTAKSGYWAVLPSVHLTGRFGRGWVMRGALWSSYAPPPIERATQPISVTLIDRAEPEFDEATEEEDDDHIPDLAVQSVRIGNVDLRPARVFNADLGLEWYRGQRTALSAALFYKQADNFMVRRQSSVIRNGATAPAELERVRERLGLGDLPLTEDFVLEMADQGGEMTLYGVELSARHMFEEGPAWRRGLGYALTATYQSSRVETGVSWHPEGYALPLFEAPDWLFGAEAFYVRPNWEAYVSWLYQSAFLEDYETYRHEPYEQPYMFVDLSLRRNLAPGAQLSLEVENLLDGPSYWYTFGRGEERLREYREAGRTISLGVSWRF